MRLYYFDRYEGNRSGGHTTESLARTALGLEAAKTGSGIAPFLTEETGLSRTEKGKPYLPDHPVHFSISHSGSLWVLLAASQPVGVDIQKSDHDNYDAISRRFFQPGEQKAVEAGGLRAFIGIWCRKEAYIKLKGSSLGDTLDWLDVAPAGILLDRAVIRGETVYFRECGLADGYVCVAASHEEEDIWTCKINIE
jgi:4'-phosphopantetheinyl transferase